MEIVKLKTYKGINDMSFGDPPFMAENIFGMPKMTKTNRSGEFEMHYNDFTLRFRTPEMKFCECTVFRDAALSLNGTPIGWSLDELIRLCYFDGEPKEYYGIVLLFSLGVSLTGLEEGCESDRTINVFARGVWDPFLDKIKAFSLPPLGE